MDINQLQTILPWIFALLTIILSFFSIKIGARNAELDRRKVVLSGNRQEWINSLRNIVAELLSIHSLFGISMRKGLNNNTDKTIQNLVRMSLLQHKIELLLNPNETDSKKLIEKIRALNAASKNSEEEMNDKEYLKIQEDIVQVTQKILKTEWERVKNIE